MEEASDPLVIPGWIWVMLVLFVVGVLVTLVIQRDRRSGRRSRSRSRGSSRGSNHRHSTTRSRHRRPRDPFEKL
jgi:hypothetical protein